MGIWEYDFAADRMTWSEQTRRLLGVEPSEPTSFDIVFSRIHEEDRQRLEEHIARCLSPDSDHSRHVEFRIRTKDGAIRWLENNVAVHTTAAGTPDRAVGVLREVTAQKNAEEAKKRLAAIVTSSTDAIIGKTLDGVITSWNDAAERIFGYSAGEMVGQSIRRLIPSDRQPEEDMFLASIARGERIENYETVRVCKSGRLIEVSVAISPIRDETSRIIGASKILRDITRRKQTETLLAERVAQLASEARFRAAFENAPVGIAHFDPGFRWLRVNEALCRILSYRADELVTKSLEEINHPDDLRACLAHVERMRVGMIDSFGMDKRYRRKDGSIVWIRLTNGCVRKSDRSIDYFVCMFEDISARKQSEEEVRQSEEQFRSLVLRSPLPILLFDDREEILALSQSWLEQTGYSKDELRRIEDWTARGCVGRSDEVLTQIRQMISTEPESLSTEVTIHAKDGRERLWTFVFSALGAQSDGRRLFVCVAKDVTERKAREEQVHLRLREVTHRAKNMLSLVQVIARQTAASEPEDFIGRFSERIQALSANQDLLVRNEWRGVDVEDLVRGQLAPFADLIGSRIDIRGPKLHLKATSAQAIGLALHELATNASKFGALSTHEGRVDVCWGVSGDTFNMSWTERRGRPVSAPKRHGFGTIVIDSMVARSVNGKVQLDYAPSGLTWRLTCPAEDSVEPREPSSIVRDRNTVRERLSAARRHVETGQLNIDRQRQLVASLEHNGHGSQEAKRLLALFKEIQKIHIAHRSRLEKELAEISK